MTSEAVAERVTRACVEAVDRGVDKTVAIGAIERALVREYRSHYGI
ncbi:hypothetical protein PV666_19380 [Streptomyces acidiscabies]|uniref:Uncharacterized protein n=2 Tax=Streptomyces acidiscabies TaxID=42234 RepID=A0ABU4LWD2_9ACTN|nr:hypothetical protein [Streptomyces acidiscabies]